MDDLGRSETIVQWDTTPCDEVQVFTQVDNRVGIVASIFDALHMDARSNDQQAFRELGVPMILRLIFAFDFGLRLAFNGGHV
jgi:hypothetical protein